MIPSHLRTVSMALSLLALTFPLHAAPPDATADAKSLDGLWLGAWGGGTRDGTVFQPVIAEMFIKGDHIEVCGFRNVGRLAGTVRLTAESKRLRITPEVGIGAPAAKDVSYTMEHKGDQLTLTDSEKYPISLHRKPVEQKPLANAQVEFVTATGINEAGDLLVTEYAQLRVGQVGATYYQPEPRTRKTKQATVFLVQENTLKKVGLDEARGLIRGPTPVVIAYRPDDRPEPQQLYQLWKDIGSPAPDSEAVAQTLSKLLRPGSLVFVLSARENVPVP